MTIIGSPTGQDVTKSSVIEYILVIVVRCKIAASIVGGRELRPIDRVEEGPADELTLNVLLQETGLEILKDSISEKPVVGRRKTSAGNARDRVHFVEHALFAAVDGDFRVPQSFKHAVGKSSGPCSPAGEGEHDQHVVIFPSMFEVLGAISPLRVRLPQGLVDGIMSAAGRNDEEDYSADPGQEPNANPKWKTHRR